MDPLGEKKRGAGVPEIVETNPRQACLLKERVQGAVPDVRRIEVRPDLRGEDKAPVLPYLPGPDAFLPLSGLVPLKGEHGYIGKSKFTKGVYALLAVCWLPLRLSSESLPY